MKIIDVFSGAGGFSRGFQDAGYDVKWGFDFDDKALETFKLNHKNSSIRLTNLFLDSEINEVIKVSKDIDGIIGGPPCQGFSLAGPRRKEDPRNKLYYSMIKIAKKIKPKFIIIENVPSLSTLYKGEALKNILFDLKKIGYFAKYKILKASNYGIPQIRRRLFIVAFSNFDHYKNFSFPKPSHKKPTTVWEAISDLPELKNKKGNYVSQYSKAPSTKYQKKMRGASDILYNHQNSNHQIKTIEMLKYIKEGENAKSLPEKYRIHYTYNDALTRLHSRKPSRTIDTGHRTIFHPFENRVPSVREAARIQSFPDNFVFCGSKSKQYRQVGNAVPPILGELIGKSVLEAIRE